MSQAGCPGSPLNALRIGQSSSGRAATGLVYPVWAMVAIAVSVTAIFVNSLWGRPALFIDAILSVGKAPQKPVAAPQT